MPAPESLRCLAVGPSIVETGDNPAALGCSCRACLQASLRFRIVGPIKHRPPIKTPRKASRAMRGALLLGVTDWKLVGGAPRIGEHGEHKATRPDSRASGLPADS